MDVLNQFIIPVSGIKDGVHTFEYQIRKSFFDAFENSIIKDGSFDVKVFFDKRPDLYLVKFEYSGSAQSECDRCLEVFDLPIMDNQGLMFKFAEDPLDEDVDIVYIKKETKEINISKYLYDYINLSVPMFKTHDDANLQCDESILEYLDNQFEETDEAPSNPIWDELKKLGDQ